MYDRVKKINIIKIDKEPFLDMFNVFEEMNLKGLSLVQAMNLVSQRAIDLYKNIKLETDIKKIHGYKYDSGRMVEVISEESAIISTINKSLYDFDYDGAIINLESLTNFYKNAFYHAKVYQYFFDYMIRLLKKFSEISEVIKEYEKMKFDLENLRNENMNYAKNYEVEKTKREIAEKRLTQYAKHFRNVVANEKVLKFFLANVNRMTTKNNLNMGIMELVIMIMYEGRLSLSDLAKNYNINKKDLISTVRNYGDLFVIIDNEYLDLNYRFEQISKVNMLKEIDDYTKSLGLDKIEVKEEESELTKKIEEEK